MVLVTRLEAVLTFWKMESMVLCVGSQCLLHVVEAVEFGGGGGGYEES